jgi:hypothetical protein
VRGAFVKRPEFVERVRGATHNGIYGLGLALWSKSGGAARPRATRPTPQGEWREELDKRGRAVLISSPSWAGAYPWIDKTTGVYGVMLAHVEGPAVGRDKFSGFYSSPESRKLSGLMVRAILTDAAKPKPQPRPATR